MAPQGRRGGPRAPGGPALSRFPRGGRAAAIDADLPTRAIAPTAGASVSHSPIVTTMEVM